MREEILAEISSNPDLFGPERGLFPIDPDADRKDAATTSDLAWRKNADFLRLKDFALYLVDPRPGLEMLEIGCSVGAQLVTCGLAGASVYGQDLDPARVAEANSKLRRLSIHGEAVAGDARALQFEDGRFDAVLSSDFHEHLTGADQVAVLAEARRVLRPGGRLVIKTPNLAYLRSSLWYKRVRALLRLRSPAGWVIPHTSGTGPDDHVGLLRRPSLTAQLRPQDSRLWISITRRCAGSGRDRPLRCCPRRYRLFGTYSARSCSAARSNPWRSPTFPTNDSGRSPKQQSRVDRAPRAGWV